MSDQENKNRVVLVLIMMLFAYGLGFATGWGIRQRIIRASAVKAGVGEYRVIDEWGTTQFEWNTVRIHRITGSEE